MQEKFDIIIKSETLLILICEGLNFLNVSKGYSKNFVKNNEGLLQKNLEFNFFNSFLFDHLFGENLVEKGVLSVQFSEYFFMNKILPYAFENNF